MVEDSASEVIAEFTPEKQRVKGWLAFFCVVQIFLDPILGIRDFLNVHFSGSLVMNTAVQIIGIATGILLWKISPRGLLAVKILLAVVVARGFAGLAWYTVSAIAAHHITPAILSKTIELAIGRFGFVFVWGLYFSTSLQVKNLFGKNLFDA